MSAVSPRATRTHEVANDQTEDEDKQSHRHADNHRQTASNYHQSTCVACKTFNYASVYKQQLEQHMNVTARKAMYGFRVPTLTRYLCRVTTSLIPISCKTNDASTHDVSTFNSRIITEMQTVCLF